MASNTLPSHIPPSCNPILCVLGAEKEGGVVGSVVEEKQSEQGERETQAAPQPDFFPRPVPLSHFWLGKWSRVSPLCHFYSFPHIPLPKVSPLPKLSTLTFTTPFYFYMASKLCLPPSHSAQDRPTATVFSEIFTIELSQRRSPPIPPPSFGCILSFHHISLNSYPFPMISPRF